MGNQKGEVKHEYYTRFHTTSIYEFFPPIFLTFNKYTQASSGSRSQPRYLNDGLKISTPPFCLTLTDTPKRPQALDLILDISTMASQFPPLPTAVFSTQDAAAYMRNHSQEHGHALTIKWSIPSLLLQSPLFISMRRDRHPYAYRAFMLVWRVDLSHTNLVGTRTGMLVGGYAYTQYAYTESTVFREGERD